EYFVCTLNYCKNHRKHPRKSHHKDDFPQKTPRQITTDPQQERSLKRSHFLTRPDPSFKDTNPQQHNVPTIQACHSFGTNCRCRCCHCASGSKCRRCPLEFYTQAYRWRFHPSLRYSLRSL
ncbi:hypothetical protein K457DRAFT_1911216, partial [Linnemannia elongata AG-77]